MSDPKPLDYADLVWRAMHNAKDHQGRRFPRWVAVKDTFAVGSTRAYELCAAFHLDPEGSEPE